MQCSQKGHGAEFFAEQLLLLVTVFRSNGLDGVAGRHRTLCQLAYFVYTDRVQGDSSPSCLVSHILRLNMSLAYPCSNYCTLCPLLQREALAAEAATIVAATTAAAVPEKPGSHSNSSTTTVHSTHTDIDVNAAAPDSMTTNNNTNNNNNGSSNSNSNGNGDSDVKAVPPPRRQPRKQTRHTKKNSNSSASSNSSSGSGSGNPYLAARTALKRVPEVTFTFVTPTT